MKNQTKRFCPTIVEKHISVKKAAEALSVHQSFLYRRISSGEVPAIRLSARRVVIPQSALVAFLNARRTTIPREETT